MHSLLPFALRAAAVLACSFSFLTAAEPLAAAPATEASLAGLQVSLTTSGYKFYLAPPTDLSAPGLKPARESFVASALVANRSNTDVQFTFPNPAAAGYRWTFRIFDRSGKQLWQSDREIFSAQVLSDATLEKRGRWKRLVEVPLRIDGQLLAPGLYWLEASIDSDKPISATTSFEVAQP